MKSVLAILLCSCFFASSVAQLKQVTIIQGDIIDFTIDNLGNIYTVSRDNQLKKINIKGDTLGSFNDIKQYGKLYSIDATNPLKVLLFYKDYGNIIVLDRFLNIRNTINLRKANIFQVTAICQSYDNGIWLYDEQAARIKRMNDEGVVIDKSGDLRQFLDQAPFPKQIIDQERLVYLYDPDQGLFIFDYFGTLRNKVTLTGWEDFQVLSGKVFGRKKNTIQQYQPGTLTLKEQVLDSTLAGIDKMKVSLSNLYCLKDGVIEVYAY